MEIQLMDLGTGPLTKVLETLDVKSILASSQACKALNELSQAEYIWRKKALALYPESTLSLEGYDSYKELVKDGNKRHATVVIDLSGRSCRYRYNRPDYFFQCRLLALEWLRSEGVLRVYLDARGESDLRHPMASSLSLLSCRGADAIQATGSSSWMSGSGEVPDALLSKEGLLAAERAPHCHLRVRKRGHMLGCMDFSFEALSGCLASREGQHGDHGLLMVFCYANSAPFSTYGFADYRAACVLPLLPGQSLEEALLQSGSFTLKGQLKEELQKEAGEEVQRAAWAHVGREVLERPGPPWLVM